MAYQTCMCNQCKSACLYKPGWYKPGEIEESAKLLGITDQEFFNKYVMVDYWVPDVEEPEPVFVLSPAIVGYQGGMAPFEPRGKCILFKDDKCIIHGAKPYECAKYIHTFTIEEVRESHKSCMLAWKDHQDRIEELLGKKPEVPDIGFADVLSLLS